MEVSEMSLNRVTIIGHLGQDPDLRYLPASGQPVASFSVATDEAFTGKDGTRQEQFLGTPPADARGAVTVEEPASSADSDVPF
jgi:single-stranded DNA-binding protein